MASSAVHLFLTAISLIPRGPLPKIEAYGHLLRVASIEAGFSGSRGHVEFTEIITVIADGIRASEHCMDRGTVAAGNLASAKPLLRMTPKERVLGPPNLSPRMQIDFRNNAPPRDQKIER